MFNETEAHIKLFLGKKSWGLKTAENVLLRFALSAWGAKVYILLVCQT